MQVKTKVKLKKMPNITAAINSVFESAVKVVNQSIKQYISLLKMIYVYAKTYIACFKSNPYPKHKCINIGFCASKIMAYNIYAYT